MNDNGNNPNFNGRHTFVVYVEDKPGVLNRVASLFRRRAFNIESISAGRSEQPGVTRLTIVMLTDDQTAKRVVANLYKLVNVVCVEDVTEHPAVMRDLALVKVQANSTVRAEVLQLCDVFRARAVDVTPNALIVEITGTEDKIESLLEVLRPFGILEIARTGRIAMKRGGAPMAVAESSEVTTTASA